MGRDAPGSVGQLTQVAQRSVEELERIVSQIREGGEMENLIKEQQLCLFADRTSARSMAVNQLRL